MAGVLGSRPAAFACPADAVQWALRTGMSRSRAAAALSIPSQLRPCAGGGGCEWITPLQQSARFWEGWYRGMSDAFLAAPAPKLLMLAGEPAHWPLLAGAPAHGRGVGWGGAGCCGGWRGALRAGGEGGV
jgi:hypothetical protein